MEELIRAHFQSVQVGENIRCTCNWCESSRAFLINPNNGLWICFSCGIKGGFPQLLNRLRLSKKLVQRYIEEYSFSFQEKGRKRKRTRTTPQILPEYLLGYYNRCPSSLLDAGFNMEVLQENEVGFDLERKRIIFPIRDLHGNLVAISGRASKSNQHPRYKVYSEELKNILPTYVPHSRDHLYLFHKRYIEYFHTEKPMDLIIVEGYKGALWLDQMGYNSVALQGSMITEQQLDLLRMVPGVKYVLLDNEEGKSFSSGTDSARHRKCDADRIIEKLDRKARLCTYPSNFASGASPDDLSKQDIKIILDNAQTRTQRVLNVPNNSWRRKWH